MEQYLKDLVYQLPVTALFIIGLVILFREFKKFLSELIVKFLEALEAQRAVSGGQHKEDLETVKNLVTQLVDLTEQIREFRGDFDKAVTQMQERTRILDKIASRTTRKPSTKRSEP